MFAEADTIKTDQALAAAIRKANNVVLPMLLESTRVNGQIIETLPLPSLASAAVDLGRVHAALDEDGIARSIYLYEGVGAPTWQHFSQAVLNVANHQASQNRFHFNSNAHLEANNPFSLTREQQRIVNFLGPPGHFLSISYA